MVLFYVLVYIYHKGVQYFHYEDVLYTFCVLYFSLVLSGCVIGHVVY